MKTVGMIIILLAGLLLSANGAKLAPDSSFNSFLERFLSDKQFQMDRIKLPLIAQLGHQGAGKVRVERWSRKQLKKNLSLPLSKRELAKEGMKQSLRKLSDSRTEVFQYKPESDSYLVTYRFEKIRGNWYLTLYKDESL